MLFDSVVHNKSGSLGGSKVLAREGRGKELGASLLAWPTLRVAYGSSLFHMYACTQS